jgi:hypothetical protein
MSLPSIGKTFTHEVAVRLTGGGSEVVVPTGKTLEFVTHLLLTEYCINNPNGGAIAPSLWRLRFKNNEFVASTTTNAGGTGHPLVISNATATHVVYDTPRVISRDYKGRLNSLFMEVIDENGSVVAFDDMTIFLTFVCADADWYPQGNAIHDAIQPKLPSQAYDSRPRFRY